MSIIGAKRFQTGVFEALASQNRAAGSGGGSGFQPLQPLGQATNQPTIVGISYSSQASIPFQIGRPTLVLFLATLCFTINDTVGDTEVITITLDGSTSPNFGAPDYSPFCMTQSPAGTTNMPSQTVFWQALVQPGNHTGNLLLGKTGGTLSNVYYTFRAWQLGY